MLPTPVVAVRAAVPAEVRVVAGAAGVVVVVEDDGRA